jgi:hypothetical protein
MTDALLGVARGAPLVSIVRTSWDVEGQAFAHSHDLFRSTASGSSCARAPRPGTPLGSFR